MANHIAAAGVNPHVGLVDFRRIRHEDERISLLEPMYDFGSLTEHRSINRGEKLPSSRENRRHAASMVATGMAYGPSDPRLKAAVQPPHLSIVCDVHAKGQTVTPGGFCASEQQGTPSRL